eukprot:15355363-Ditylum_brightwellii.AAC.1
MPSVFVCCAISRKVFSTASAQKKNSDEKKSAFLLGYKRIKDVQQERFYLQKKDSSSSENSDEGGEDKEDIISSNDTLSLSNIARIENEKAKKCIGAMNGHGR